MIARLSHERATGNPRPHDADAHLLVTWPAPRLGPWHPTQLIRSAPCAPSSANAGRTCRPGNGRRRRPASPRTSRPSRSTCSARSIACYLSLPTEPNTRPFVNWARGTGHPGAVPHHPAGRPARLDRRRGAGRDRGHLRHARGRRRTARPDRDQRRRPHHRAGRRRRRDRHAHGLGSRLLRQDARFDGELSSGVRRRLRHRVRRRGAPRACTTHPVDGVVTPTRILAF